MNTKRKLLFYSCLNRYSLQMVVYWKASVTGFRYPSHATFVCFLATRITGPKENSNVVEIGYYTIYGFTFVVFQGNSILYK